MNGAARVCVALLVACSGAGGWSAELSSEGGTVVGDGVELRVPAGALASPTRITITRIDADPPSGWRALSDAYRFEPEGLTFATPVEVRFETRASHLDERVLWQNGTLEVLEATRSSNTLSAEVTHFSTGMAGGPDDDGGADAGADASSDAPTDGGSDAAIAMANLDCWNDELLPSDHISSRLVTRGTEVLYTDHEILWRRDEAGTWTSTNLPEEVGFGPAEPEWRDSVMTVDDDGNIHVALADNSDLGERVPNFPYHVRETDAGWVVERVPYEQYYIFDYPERGPCNTGTSGGGPPDLFLTDLLVHRDEVHLTFECRWYGASGEHSVLHCLREESWATCTMLDPLAIEYQQRPGPRASQLGFNERGVHLYMNGIYRDPFERWIEQAWIVGQRAGGEWLFETHVERVDDVFSYPAGRLLPRSPVLYYQRAVETLEGAMSTVSAELRRAVFDLEAGVIERSTVWTDEPWIWDEASVIMGWNPSTSLDAVTERFGLEYILVRPDAHDPDYVIITRHEDETLVHDVPIDCQNVGDRRVCSLVVDDAGSLHAAYAEVVPLPPFPLHHSWTCSE